MNEHKHEQQISSAIPAKYFSLVNQDRIRTTVKRLFSGQVHEILGELFQNSQRAGAKNVEVVISDDLIQYNDNGVGLSSIEDFYSLLCIGESDFNENVQENQKPMGLGFHVLLAHEDVASVAIFSKGFSTEIDCERWWNDSAYYASWFQRIIFISSEVHLNKGLTLEIRIKSPSFAEAVSHFLPERTNAEPSDSERWANMQSEPYFPAIGYSDYLKITKKIVRENSFIDSDVETRFLLPSSFNMLFETTYQGCALKIYMPNLEEVRQGYYKYKWLTPGLLRFVNWYGQLVRLNSKALPNIFGFYLEVKAGHPIDMMAPSRKGVINNEKLVSFEYFIFTAITNHVMHMEVDDVNLKTPLVEAAMKMLFDMSSEKLKNFPFFIAKRVFPYRDQTQVQEYFAFDWTSNVDYEQEEVTKVFAIKQPPSILLDFDIPVVECHKDEKGGIIYSSEESADFLPECASSFVSMIEEKFEDKAWIIQIPSSFAESYATAVKSLYQEKLQDKTKRIYWLPGERYSLPIEITSNFQSYYSPSASTFSKRGEWALEDRNVDISRHVLWPVTTDVFLLEDGTSDFLECGWSIGCEDMLEFLKNKALAGLDFYTDDDPYEVRERYERSVNEVMMTLLGDVVSRDFTRIELEQFINRHANEQRLKLKSVELEADGLLIKAESEDGSLVNFKARYFS